MLHGHEQLQLMDMRANETAIRVTEGKGQAGSLSLRLGLRLLAGLASRNVALALMGLLLASLAAQALFPQQGRVSELQYTLWRANYPGLSRAVNVLGLDRVAAMAWFWGIGAALATSLGVSTLRRAMRLLRHGQLPRGARVEHWVADAPDALPRVAPTLGRLGYRVTAHQEGLAAQRGTFGSWGSILFHGGMLVLVAGAFLSAGVRFTGYVEIAPGQVFQPGDTYAQVRSGFLAHDQPQIWVNVEDIDVSFWPDGSVKEVQAEGVMWGRQGEESQGVARRNRTMKAGGVTLTMGSPLGPAALLEYRPKGALAGGTGYVHFTEAGGRLTNRFTLPGTATQVEASLVGDWRAALEGRAEALPPSLKVQIAGAGEDAVLQPKDAALVELQLGQSVALADGELRFAGLRPWVLFMISQDRGLPIMVAGGVVGLLGLTLALLMSPRWILVRRQSDGWQIEGRSPGSRTALRRDVEGLAQEMEGGYA